MIVGSELILNVVLLPSLSPEMNLKMAEIDTVAEGIHVSVYSMMN